ncbi:MAG TPA: hypothetical protein VH331_16320 [Allosphingosinicella sp.]|jgi:hypothetical protein|nr:hypothetical protein [Allosphingosinicella sp.]
MADGRRRRLFIWGALGLLAWFVVEFMAVGIAGGGHGWFGPMFFALPLLLLYPAAFIRAFAPKARSAKIDTAMLAVGVVLDLLLLRNMFFDTLFFDEREDFMKVWTFADSEDHAFLVLWFALWAAWQVLTAATFLRARWSRRATAGGVAGHPR